jgi:hypothetical protein
MRPEDTRMLPPTRTMPRTIPATSSAAVMARGEVCGGADVEDALHEPRADQGRAPLISSHSESALSARYGLQADRLPHRLYPP